MNRNRGGERGADGERDVVLVTIDALRADHVGFLDTGSPPTPTLNAFAEDSDALVCTRAFAGAPYTRGSFPAIMTGWHDRGAKPTERRPHIASTVSAAGYQTAAVHSNPNLAAGTHYEQGFDRFEDDIEEGSGGVFGLFARAREAVEKALGTYEPYLTARETTDRSLAQLDAMGETGPRFLWTHFMDTHAPYRPREGTESASVSSRTSQRLWEVVRTNDASSLTDDELATLRRLYRGEVEYLDRELDRFLTGVEDRCDDPVVLLVSDHGDLFGEEGLLAHPNCLHDALVHVPLAGRGLGVSGRYDGPVSTCDIHATLATAVGIEPPETQGTAIQPLDPDDERFVFAQSGVVDESLRVMATDGRYQLRRQLDEGGPDRLIDRSTGTDLPPDRTPPPLADALADFAATIGRDGGMGEEVTAAVARRLEDLGYT